MMWQLIRQSQPEVAMPIATLRFRLPDEQAEFDAARQGQAAKAILWDIDQACRSLVKYGEPVNETKQFAERIRAMIRDTPESLLD